MLAEKVCRSNIPKVRHVLFFLFVTASLRHVDDKHHVSSLQTL